MSFLEKKTDVTFRDWFYLKLFAKWEIFGTRELFDATDAVAPPGGFYERRSEELFITR